MILSFKCKKTKNLYESAKSRHFSDITKTALRKLDMIEAAKTLDDLKVPPGNQFEALQGDRLGQHSIRINKQWRICFVWDEAHNSAIEVEIVDYH
ncbi:type II toxin-antitoxin system RelE/ParE family toxin [Desulfovibrio psychrotolerans]|uniref:Killer protein n=1 Tax=Desulfovibrio psychrotolerans TaxID=415242 RepID=A0A7J0BX12_9BACT|nr:type II toxin-antitoxin system RelE/ParE family toxin [Desulfovibrio psychrotolerans]GFM37715.1 killer protein [Desulfovibrio psychrotolerans]